MIKFFAKVAVDLRAAIAAVVVVLLLTGLSAHRLAELRNDHADARAESARVEMENLDLQARLEKQRAQQAALPIHERGLGPGGIQCAAEGLFFDGPTAARAALSLVVEADGAGFSEWRYESDHTHVVASFPPAAESDDEMAAASRSGRSRVSLVQWPLDFWAVTDWESAVDLLARLADAQPAFGLETIAIEPYRDDVGELTGELSLRGTISGYWLEPEA